MSRRLLPPPGRIVGTTWTRAYLTKVRMNPLVEQIERMLGGEYREFVCPEEGGGSTGG
jgi:hypothetical protein